MIFSELRSNRIIFVALQTFKESIFPISGQQVDSICVCDYGSNIEFYIKFFLGVHSQTVGWFRPFSLYLWRNQAGKAPEIRGISGLKT